MASKVMTMSSHIPQPTPQSQRPDPETRLSHQLPDTPSPPASHVECGNNDAETDASGNTTNSPDPVCPDGGGDTTGAPIPLASDVQAHANLHGDDAGDPSMDPADSDVERTSTLRHLTNLLGEEVLFLPCNEGEKGTRKKGWTGLTIASMRDNDYISELEAAAGLSVATGEPSGGLCSIDLDDDDLVEPFLAQNPRLRETLKSVGRRGCNLWVRIVGDYPGVAFIKTNDGSKWGEWRSTGCCTMIHGRHPEGMAYTRSPEVPPITMSFGDLNWPDDLCLPWLATSSELPGDGEDSDGLIIERFGRPVLFTKPDSSGICRVRGINEAYWAGLYASESTIVYEPDERSFFKYDANTGIYSVVSPDVIKEEISYRMLEVSRQAESLNPLEGLRTDRNLNAITSRLKGITEHRGAFADRPQAVHLGNCMLRFEDGRCIEEVFSPEFRSRNRSPIAFDPEAQCPRFLGELLLPAVHPEDAVLLQKMAGQCLLGDNLVQRFVILDGEAGRGKSQYAIAVQALIGHENTTQLRTWLLNERFELFRYRNRTLLTGVDVDEDFLTSRGAPVIKGLVGGDRFDAEQKGGTGSFQFQGRFNILMTSNCRLKVKLQGDVGAWRRRMLIVRYESPPPRVKIPDFGELLIREEGPGILNWALHGVHLLLRDISETGDIRLTPRQANVVDSLLAESESLRCFLRECVERDEGRDLAVSEIEVSYANFCPERGWDPQPLGQISRQLPSLMMEMFRSSRSNDCSRGGRAVRGYRHVRLITRDQP